MLPQNWRQRDAGATGLEPATSGLRAERGPAGIWAKSRPFHSALAGLVGRGRVVRRPPGGRARDVLPNWQTERDIGQPERLAPSGDDNWTAYGIRGAAPAAPLVCRPAPPRPPAIGACGISAGWKRRVAPHENEKSLQNPDSRAGIDAGSRWPAVVCANAGEKRYRFAGILRERRNSNPRPPA